ncbi:anti-sigma factor [Streptomyces phaeoluteigriseus]|uniref:Regulator of SigK n=1 Tax=Streptomyces phaeoluteigriseus TaxID=114686 RepID=A0ABY4ZB16_9ACTN|nr:anti-sigma factor [Streptomyces phaeoluteigriseus]USQ86227.1 anti-sigma factor [Streptomyces phaeoluteigriseus]
MTPQEDPHLALGAYVLHALPPAEEAAFENHLAGCETCRDEVASLQEAAAALATVHAMPVAPHLRADTLDAITRVSQDRPRHRARTAGRRALHLVLAASIAAVAALGGTAVWQHSQAEDARAEAARVRSTNEALTDVVTAPDATLHTAELTGGATAAVVVSRDRGSAVFTAQGLPDLTGDKVYELWYAADTGALRPAGLLDGGMERDARVLEGALAGAVAVGITVEPSGGSKQPTTEPLGLISLTS